MSINSVKIDAEQLDEVIGLFRKINIFLNKIPKSDSKTPDLESQNLLVEVKEINPLVHGVDFIVRNLIKALRRAIKQFKEYDPDSKKIHIIVLFIDFYELSELEEDLHSCFTGKFSKITKERIYPSSWALSSEYQEMIDGIIWYKNNEFRHAWYLSKAEGVIKELDKNLNTELLPSAKS